MESQERSSEEAEDARGPFASALMMSMVSKRECCFRVLTMNDSMSAFVGLGQKNAMPCGRQRDGGWSMEIGDWCLVFGVW